MVILQVEHIAFFVDEEDAARAFDRMARTLRGPYAETNFPLPGEAMPAPAQPAEAAGAGAAGMHAPEEQGSGGLEMARASGSRPAGDSANPGPRTPSTNNRWTTKLSVLGLKGKLLANCSNEFEFLLNHP